MPDTSLKAFVVQEDCEGTGGVIFARHAITARRIGADEYADSDFHAVTCRRAPWADRYAEARRVPARDMIAHGWLFECACGHRLDLEFLEEKRLPLDGVIGAGGGRVYCSSRCARKRLSFDRRRKAQERKAIEAFKQTVRARFPDADFVDDEQSSFRGHHAYVVAGRRGWRWQQVIVSFRFPGMRYGPAQLQMEAGNGEYTPRKGAYTVPSGDQAAFEAWAAAQKEKADA